MNTVLNSRKVAAPVAEEVVDEDDNRGPAPSVTAAAAPTPNEDEEDVMSYFSRLAEE